MVLSRIGENKQSSSRWAKTFVFLFAFCCCGCYQKDLLTDRLISKDDAVRVAALKEFYKLDHESKKLAFSRLVDRIKNDLQYQEESAALEIVSNSKNEAREYATRLVSLLGNEDAWVVDFAASMFYRIGLPAASILETAFKNTRDARLLAGIIEALDRIGHFSDSTLNLLVNATKHSDWNVRLQAVEALENNIGDPMGLVDRFRGLVKDENPRVRKTAIRFFRYTELPEPYWAVLFDVVNNDLDTEVRAEAIDALGTLGRRAQVAIPLFIKATKFGEGSIDEHNV